MISAIAAAMPLADNEFGDTQTDGVAGPLGLLIIVLLVIATVLLIRNMSGRIKRLPQEFPPASEHRPADDEKPPSGDAWKSDSAADGPDKD
jgi:hypothetical protein